MKRHLKSGTIALVSLIAMALLLTIALGLSGLTMQNLRRSPRDTSLNLALQAAQAGVELQIARCFGAIEEEQGRFVAQTAVLTTDLAAVAPGATATAWVSPFDNGRQAWVTCNATIRGFTRSVRVRIDSKNVSIWNNAVFAGTGASGQAINGNVDVRGSVHMLGEGEKYSDLNGNAQWDPAESYTDSNRNGVWDPGEPFVDSNGDGVWSAAEPFNDANRNGIYDEPLTSADLNSSFSGNAYVGNNYSGIPSDLEALIPPIGLAGEVKSLAAEYRVKHGRTAMSGTATIGLGSLIDGGMSKNTLDGVFTNDGFGGNQGAAAVFSDNGTNQSYDLDGYDLGFPYISGIGAIPYEAPDGSNWDTYEEFYDAKALTVPVATITSTTAAFSYGPDANGNRISFTPATTSGGVTIPATLNVQGVVKFAGDLQIGSKDVIRYTGNGTMYSAGTIRVDGDFLPAPGQIFPTTSRVGLVARKDLMLATGNGSSQLKMAGAFYAMGTIVSRKQNQIAGTFVGSYFDMGTNVPNIYQVPTLVNNMPPAMPGDRNIYALRTRSWRERPVSN
jgi:hypothetical protein